ATDMAPVFRSPCGCASAEWRIRSHRVYIQWVTRWPSIRAWSPDRRSRPVRLRAAEWLGRGSEGGPGEQRRDTATLAAPHPQGRAEAVGGGGRHDPGGGPRVLHQLLAYHLVAAGDAWLRR